MSKSKQCSENPSPDKFASKLKALGHPSRVDIIRQIAQRDRCCAGDFCDCLSLAQSTISQHLEMLCDAGLVERELVGTRSIFTLNGPAFEELAASINAFSDSSLCGCNLSPKNKNVQKRKQIPHE